MFKNFDPGQKEDRLESQQQLQIISYCVSTIYYKPDQY